MFRSIVAAVAIAAVLATPARAEETELEDLIAAYIQSFAPIPAAALQVAQDLTAIAQAQEALDNALAQAENGNGDPALIDQLGLALVAAIQQYDADVQTLANLVGGTEVLLAAVWKPNADRAKIVSFVPGIRPTIVGGIQLNITTAPRVQVEARVWGDGSQQFGYFQLVEISGEDRVHVGGSLNPILFPNPAGIIWPNAELAWDHIDLPQRGLGETAIFVLEVYDDEGHLLDVSAQFSATF